MKICAVLAVAALALALAPAVSAQPFASEAGVFEQGINEPMQRNESNYTGFVFNFVNAPVRLPAWLYLWAVQVAPNRLVCTGVEGNSLHRCRGACSGRDRC